MSADSALQTYETMSEKYKEYCNPMKLIGVDEQKEFQDFWYDFAVNYTNTKPHQGYDILNNWCHRKKLKRLNSNRNSKSNTTTTTTTTCDGQDIVEASTSKKCFRCSCRIGYYNASATDYDYNYDDYDEEDQEQQQQQQQQLKLKPRMGKIWNRWNERVNEVMTDRCHNNVIDVHDLGEEEKQQQQQQQQQLIWQCQECNTLPMRPNVLLFHDTDINILNSIQKQSIRYQQWEAIIEEELISSNNSNKPNNNNENQSNQNNSSNNHNNNNSSSKSTNFVLLEIGCGKNVPAVRNESEEILKDCLDKLTLARMASTTVANNNDNDHNNNNSNNNKNNNETLQLIDEELNLLLN
ncbi:hypothetical protein FRACYDRAFT_256870 [Fragilariopsis cylindrus CCMP1102]|uniref:Uncharacterized protein n=1 Tax=Fragilariopsis cylindrus CCMP1102 TaxID=635003 RepID=A0A1E7EJF0_9STRA|nr:hypothetical protein FRACYDRAFT_256870 [Fragilariopsis cylindrus CCMP1102]|eukprot:OEU06017.1 hypothetical protein FRACYDRAFT_256870 [Fragilariopsis cylindrus CCMP1102]